MDTINRDDDENQIKICLNNKEKQKLDKIVKELYQAKSIHTNDIGEFLKFTIFIVFYEYEKNKMSLNEFYRQNKEIYIQSNKEA